MLEISITLVVLSVALLSAASAFSTSLHAVQGARRTTSAAVFLETVLEDLSTQPYGSLLAFDGNQVFDGETLASSEIAIDLTVFQAQVDLLQIRAVATDLHTGREVTRVITQRCNR